MMIPHELNLEDPYERQRVMDYLFPSRANTPPDPELGDPEYGYFNMTGKNFRGDMINKNEVVAFDGKTTFARIPKLKGRISRKKKGDAEYIVLLVDREYIPEKKQTRNKKVIIGSDMSFRYPGFMLINEKYHDYFDKEGNLYNDPLAERIKAEKALEQENETTEAAEDVETNPANPETQEDETPQPQEEAQEQRNSADLMVIQAAREQEERQAIEQAFLQLEKQYETLRIREKVKLSAAEEKRIAFLKSILELYYTTIEDGARRKPDRPMSTGQVQEMTNLLRELRMTLCQGERAEFLKLPEEALAIDEEAESELTEKQTASSEGEEKSMAEIPAGENQEERHLTYGEMFFLLCPYRQLTSTLLGGNLWKKP